jgi:hypothetical protein
LFVPQPRRRGRGVVPVTCETGLLSCGLTDAGRVYFAASCCQAERDFHSQVMEDIEAAGEDL